MLEQNSVKILLNKLIFSAAAWKSDTLKINVFTDIPPRFCMDYPNTSLLNTSEQLILLNQSNQQVLLPSKKRQM